MPVPARGAIPAGENPGGGPMGALLAAESPIADKGVMLSGC